jgi:hypothetical protein
MTSTPLPEAPAQPAILVSIPASDQDVFSSVDGPVKDRLERDWHDGSCGCPDVDLTGTCEQFGDTWREQGPYTYTPERVLFALRDRLPPPRPPPKPPRTPRDRTDHQTNRGEHVTTSGQYAHGTSVDSAASRAEIERTLVRYGASSFVSGWQDDAAMIGFVADGRQVRFVLRLPDPSAPEFTRTPTGQIRTTKAARSACDQAVRQRWRALALVVKAKLEAVASGIVSFDAEFYANTVLPDGRTVFEATIAAVEQAHTTGVVPPLLQIERR